MEGGPWSGFSGLSLGEIEERGPSLAVLLQLGSLAALRQGGHMEQRATPSAWGQRA